MQHPGHPAQFTLEIGRSHLLLADGVGLGKTVQSGIAITEDLENEDVEITIAPANAMMTCPALTRRTCGALA